MSEQSLKEKMAEVEKFKTAIPRVRDILRSCSITGMDSMRHICFYLLSRYITNENVDELEVPKHLSWENIFIKSFEENLSKNSPKMQHSKYVSAPVKLKS